MSKPIVYCRSDEYLEDALRIMEKNRIRRLPVIDENKRLVGMLALGDISEKGGRDPRRRSDALGVGSPRVMKTLRPPAWARQSRFHGLQKDMRQIGLCHQGKMPVGGGQFSAPCGRSERFTLGLAFG